MRKIERLSILPDNLRKKFIVAFACMSILPLLVAIYIVTRYVFPFAETIWLTSLIVLFVMLISFCGFYVMEEIIDSILNLSNRAKRLTESPVPQANAAGDKDEIAVIDTAISVLADNAEKRRRRVEELEVRDTAIGVYKERHIREELKEELNRARLYQRPCSILVVRFIDTPGTEGILEDEQNESLALISLKSFLSKFGGELAKMGRLGRTGLCMILPEHNRRQAAAITEDILSGIDGIEWGELRSLTGWKPEIAVTVAAAPVDGFDVSELLGKCLTQKSSPS
jgi:GGDEF domain-containing protein